MSRLRHSTCLLVAFLFSGVSATAQDTTEQQTCLEAVEPTIQDRPMLVVANERMLHRIQAWIDVPTMCLFDRADQISDDTEEWARPTLPITQMLGARVFVYCPSDESMIEAIYRERLANHGVKIVPVVLESRRPAIHRRQDIQKQTLIALLK